MASPKVVLFEPVEEVERPEGVRTTWMAVTPEWAFKQLDAYETFCDAHPTERKNRPVHQSQVSRYATDMKAGKWGRHHQGLAFDREGVLMDGQHRLWAVHESGVTVMMPVTWGLDREAQLTIDSGLKRTTADVAAIAGFDGVQPIHVGIAKMIARGSSQTNAARNLTRMQELELLRDHWAAISFVLEIFPKSKKIGLTRAPVMGAVARAWYTADRDKLKRFVDVLVSGLTQREDEHVIITLRNWLMTNRSAGGQASTETYGKASRALHAFVNGERIRTLYASKDDLFKLPVLRKRT